MFSSVYVLDFKTAKMNLIVQPNRWSCLPTAFAMAIGITVEEMVNAIGHDGSKIIWPDLPEPRCRRGFHTQECIRVALLLGKSVTPVEYESRLAPGDVTPLTITNHRWFSAYLTTSCGVVTGVVGQNGTAKGHALAYSYTLVADPTTGTITDWLPDGFRPTCLWIVQ